MAALLGGLWNKAIAVVVAVVAGVAVVLGWRAKIRAEAKGELSAQIQARTLERINEAESVERYVAGLSDDAVDDQLRKGGWTRD